MSTIGLGSFRSELSDNTYTQSEDRQVSLLSDITKLQTMESNLYKKLEAADANNSSQDEQNAMVAKINELSNMRMSLFEEIDKMYKSVQGRVSQSRIDLTNQLTVSGVMEQELNKAKRNLNLLQANKDNKMRLVEINTYYSNKYQAQTGLMKLIILVCIPLLVLAILAKKQILPRRVSTFLIWAVLIIGGILIIRKFLDINSRNNMSFQEYDWRWSPPSDDGQTVLQYDEAQFQGAVQSAEDDATDAASAMGLGCIGAECCSTGTYYDSDKNECVFGSSKSNRPSTVSEGYANYMPSVSYIEVERTPCPFKPGKSNVKAFNKQQDNFVKI
ncbi:hypothetical protein N9O88_00765 [bacterium]|nr:hypothetical protein [bacterium]